MSLNRQETYDKVRDHLMTQGRKSINPDGTCMYNGPRGLHCAIGALIDVPPECDYGPPVDGLPPPLKRRLGVTTQADELFLAELQQLHDEYPVSEWAQALYDFALAEGLRP